MKTKLGIVCALVCVLLLGLVLVLSSCSGGADRSSDSSARDASEPIATADESSPAETSDVEPATVPEDSTNQPSDVPTAEPSDEDVPPIEPSLLSWTRDAGGLNHCDRLTISAEGRVAAITCRAGVSQPPIVSQLTDEQLARVNAWVEAYAAFTRREMEISRAVRTTMLEGIGSEAPPIEIKQEIASFCAELYLGLAEDS